MIPINDFDKRCSTMNMNWRGNATARRCRCIT